MKKFYIFFPLMAALICGPLLGQTNTFPPSGGVGIGTIYPTGSLHIKGGTGSRGITLEVAENSNGAQSPMMVWDARAGGADYLFYLRQQNNNLAFYRFTAPWTGGLAILTLKGENGNIGVGTASPTHKLHVAGSGKWTGNASGYTEVDSNPHGQYLRQFSNDGTSVSWVLRGYSSYAGEPQAEFNNGGINVNGTVKAKEVNVTMSGWADHVFEENYPLPDLKALEKYIAKNKHLPNIPSEKEVVAKGVSLGEMDAKLLEKIEELTLYIIRQQKEIDSLKEGFSRVKAEAGR